MRIIIDVTYSPSGGALTQIVNMVDKFNSIDDIEVVIYSKHSNREIFKKFNKKNKIILSKMSNISNITRLFWCHFVLPFYLLKRNNSILFCPGNFSPLFSPVKTVVWIGTIGPFYRDFFTNFSLLDQLKLYLNKFFMIASSKSADAVIFESEFTKQMFINNYNLKADNGHVINIGFDDYFLNTNTDDADQSIKNLANNGKFILCVSHLYPYKNIIRLLRSFKKVLDQADSPISLIIAGSMDYKSYNKEIKECIEDLQLKKNVILLGMVNKRNLKYLYLNCKMLVFPSPYENFAYTLVEAMSCKAPIVCSNTTAMPESCKDAAIYFDPFDEVDIANKILLLLNSKKLENFLSNKSLLRAKELPSFEESTVMTLNIMKNIS
jgi:glycosyltransferase involved in cell wall biosynthesis